MFQRDDCWLPLGVFSLWFLCVAWQDFDGLQRIPGDIGDARLNNYFLENVFLFFTGRTPSLWHLPFFTPFPWVLGFSDNLFGSAPVYMLFRFLGAPSDTAFQLWFMAGHAVNFAAAWWALRRLGGSNPAACVGALIFAFALPTMAHMGHAQLHYRAGIPLALVFMAEFLEHQRLRALLLTFAWLVWQFWAGVYMGFFALLLMFLMVVVHLALSVFRPATHGLLAQASALTVDWSDRDLTARVALIAGFTLLLAALLLLFWPYLQVMDIYGAKRSWDEISVMLPRPQSYILSDQSALWGGAGSTLFADIPMRHEHQMFAGAVPLLMVVAGLVAGFRFGAPRAVWLMTGAMALMIALTLNIGGHSLWAWFYSLPLASAIRAMTRFDQVILFPMAALAVVALDTLRVRRGARPMRVASAVVIVLGIAEMMQNTAHTSSRQEWRDRIAAAEAVFDAAAPGGLSGDSILFMAQRDGPYFANELDAMWVAARHGVPTMNGYSGNLPPGSNPQFGTDCSEIARRIGGYQALFPTDTPDADYAALAGRVVPVGFPHCAPDILTTRQVTALTAPYPPEALRALSWTIRPVDSGTGIAIVDLHNASDQTFAAGVSPTLRALRMSWRFLTADGAPLSGWDNRQAMPRDLTPGSATEIVLPLGTIPEGAVRIEVSVVQEGEFWLHDAVVGTKPVSSPLK